MNTKRKLITEVSHNIKIDKSGNDLSIVGVFSSAELMNINGRKYPKNILEREITKINEKVVNKSSWGELGHPATPDINPDKIAILIESLGWDGNDVVGKAKVLPTPMGNIARTLIEFGKIGISSRGLGTVSEKDNNVNEDFNLITWDLVTDPSNHPSWVKGVYEGTSFEVPDIDKQMELEEAKKQYTKRIWQVLDDIGKKI